MTIPPPKQLYGPSPHVILERQERATGLQAGWEFNFNDLKLEKMHLSDHISWTESWYRLCTAESQGGQDCARADKMQPTGPDLQALT